MISVMDDNLLRHKLRVEQELHSYAHIFVALEYTVRRGGEVVKTAALRDNPNAYRKEYR